MKNLPRILGWISFACWMGWCALGAAAVHDLATDFDWRANPNGVWSYGAKEQTNSAMTLCVRGYATTLNSQPMYVREYTAGVWPAIYCNASTVGTIRTPEGEFPPRCVWYAAGEDGTTRNFGVIRFTVPAGGAGAYDLVTTAATALNGSSARDGDYRVVHNGVQLFARSMQPNTAVGFTNRLDLGEGDTVDFMVGRGPDGVQAGSLLKVQATFTQVTNPTPPSISMQPLDQVVVVGENAAFAVVAAGTPALSYQWRFNDQDIPGAMQSTLSLSQVQFSDAGEFRVVVANAIGMVTSQVARLTVTPPPVPVRVVDVDAAAGTEVVVPVVLSAAGNENALGFSLHFDTNLAAYVSVASGQGVPAGGSLVINELQAAAGRVGVAVALAPGTTFPTGAQEVVAVRLAVRPFPSSLTIPIQFADQPTARQVSDLQAAPIPATFETGAIHVGTSRVSALDTLAASGGEATVRVQLVAQGNENALAFSLNFNSAVLGFVEAQPGAAIPPSGTLIVNGTGAAAGRVGVAVALPAGAFFPAGTQEVAVLRMSVAPVLSGSTVPITFGDDPTARQVSDGLARVVPSAFTPGTVTITEVQFEGDSAPRPEGDRALTIVDFVQLGRFVASLDTIGSPSEFQRVDCAPRATRGNGAITVSDLVQSGRYTVGLDPLTPVGGPEAEGAGGAGFAAFQPASGPELELVPTAMESGQAKDLAVNLMSGGVENALSFSVSFDSGQLTFVGATLGSGASGATLIVNSNLASGGRIGLVLALPPGQVLATGAQELARLRFGAKAGASGATSLQFVNQPVAMETTDAFAATLPTTYTGGLIQIESATLPRLSIMHAGGLIHISWESGGVECELESASRAGGGTWSAVGGVVEVSGRKLAVLSADGDARFFRLKRP